MTKDNIQPDMMADVAANNRRIAKNTLMLYVRMLVGMLVSLYTSRVLLNALGVEDYGIYGAVGGFVSMFSLISSALTSSVSRFLTFELGTGNKERLKAVFASDFDLALKTSLYADTYNEEFVKLDGYSIIPFWQGSGIASAEHLKINAVPASGGPAVVKDGVVAVLFDEYAAAVCNEEPEVSSIYNPEGRFWNYFYTYDASFMNDLGENVIVFTVEDTE